MGKKIESGAHSFADVECTITGPFGLNAYTSGEAEGGYSVEFEGDKGVMVRGAGGAVMHSLMVGQPGTFTLRLLKTSSFNAQLSTGYNLQTGSASTYANMTIVIDDFARGDKFTCLGVAFRKHPNTTWANNGGEMEWVFNCSYIGPMLGAGVDQVFSV